MVPLHIVEVTLRNAVVEAIETVHGGTWPWSAGFLRSLPNPTPPNYSPQRDLNVLGSKHTVNRRAKLTPYRLPKLTPLCIVEIRA